MLAEPCALPFHERLQTVTVDTSILLHESFARLGRLKRRHRPEYSQSTGSHLPEDEQEYTIDRYPAGSGRTQHILLSESDGDDGSDDGHDTRRLAGLRLDRGERVCVVGWVELTDFKHKKISSPTKQQRERPVYHPGVEGLIIRANHLMNVSSYRPTSAPEAKSSGMVTKGDEDKTAWGRRRGLRQYDET